MNDFLGRVLPVLAGLLLIVVAALVQGRWSERWASQSRLAQSAERINNVPLQIGAWQGSEGPQADQRSLDVAGAKGSLSRVYKDAETGEEVSVFVVVGELDDVFTHTPDRCYPAAGFEMLGSAEELSARTEIGDAGLLSTRFGRPGSSGRLAQRVFWTFSAGGPWTAPKNPKLHFGGLAQHAVFKVYVIGAELPGRPIEQSPAWRFLPELLPALTRTYFAEPAVVNTNVAG